MPGVRDQPEIVQCRSDTGRVVLLLGDGEILLQQGLRPGVVPLVDSDDPEIVQRPGDTVLISNLPRDRQTFLMEARRRVPVALALRQDTRAVLDIGD